MFAITERVGEGVVLVAGDLVAATAPELDLALQGAAQGVVLDLSELRRLDAQGVSCLRRWREQGMKLHRMSPLISLLLQSDPDPRSE
jgi:anti-anti-sigma regulatory factor